MKNTYNYFDKVPKIAKDAFIAPGAMIVGDVEIASQVGIWFNTVIRADVAEVKIGARTNIQDGSVVHVTREGHPTFIGEEVTIGHKALIHACTLEDRCFVGMGAIVMDDAVIEEGGMLAAGALLTGKKIVKKGELWAGSPAKFLRKLTDAESRFIKISADNYAKHVNEYLQSMKI